MIKINLLAEGKRAVTRKAKAAPRAGAVPQDIGPWLLLGGFALAVVVVGGWWFLHKRIIASKDRDIAAAQVEVNKLQAIIKEVEDYQRKKAELEHKISVITNLKLNQQGPVRIMDQVSRALPELLWLDRMQVTGATITLTGQAFNTNAVANFIENLDKVPEFQEPILRDTRQSAQVYTFVINFGYALPKPGAEEPAPAGG
jgi:type IV pilus assembly protein PilN